MYALTSHMYLISHIYVFVGKSQLTVVSTKTAFILVLLFINYCITYLYDACKPAFPHPALSHVCNGILSQDYGGCEASGPANWRPRPARDLTRSGLYSLRAGGAPGAHRRPVAGPEGTR